MKIILKNNNKNSKINSIRAFFLLWDDDGINVQSQNRQREILPRINFPKSIYTFREDFKVDPEAAEYLLRGIGHRIEHETSISRNKEFGLPQ